MKSHDPMAEAIRAADATGGEFTMGPDLGWSDEKPCHRVRGDDRIHTAETLPVAGGKIVAAGSLAAMRRALGNEWFTANKTFADKVVTAGRINSTRLLVLNLQSDAGEAVATASW